MVTDDENLREQVRKARQAVTRKIARIRRVTGAEVSGTEYDPRVPLAETKGYSSQALRIYLYELQSFTDRSVQFERIGKFHVPAPREMTQEYQRIATNVYNNAMRFQDAIKDIVLPLPGRPTEQRGSTIGFFQGMLRRPPKRDQSWSPFQVYERKLADFKDVAALQKMINKLYAQQFSEQHYYAEVKREMEHLAKGLEHIGETGLLDEVRDLSPDQFAVVWWGTGFQRTFWLAYELKKKILEGRAKDSNIAVLKSDTERDFDTNMMESRELVEFGKKIIPETIEGLF